MKVKCIKYLNNDLEPQETEDSSLIKGEEYIVLMVYANDRYISYYIQYSEDSLGAYFDSRQFIVTSNYIPDNWIIIVSNEFKSLRLIPKKWEESDEESKSFFEKLHDDDPAAVELFLSECYEMYKQEDYFAENYLQK